MMAHRAVMGRIGIVTCIPLVGGGNRMDAAQGQMEGDAAEFARRVEAVLAKVRPALQADGGDIELVAVEGQNARVRLKGACHG